MNGLATASKRYTEKSFRAFLDGQSGCNEKWVLGIARASTPQDITGALISLATYGNQERLGFLRRTFEVA